MYRGHEQLDESLLHVKRLDEARKAGSKDMLKPILIEEAREAREGALWAAKASA